MLRSFALPQSARPTAQVDMLDFRYKFVNVGGKRARAHQIGQSKQTETELRNGPPGGHGTKGNQRVLRFPRCVVRRLVEERNAGKGVAETLGGDESAGGKGLGVAAAGSIHQVHVSHLGKHLLVASSSPPSLPSRCPSPLFPPPSTIAEWEPRRTGPSLIGLR